MTQQVKAAQAGAKAANDALAALRMSHASIEQSHAGELAVLKAQIELLKGDLSLVASTEFRAAIKERIENLQRELEDLRQQAQDLQVKLQAQQNENQRLTQQVEDLKAKAMPGSVLPEYDALLHGLRRNTDLLRSCNITLSPIIERLPSFGFLGLTPPEEAEAVGYILSRRALRNLVSSRSREQPEPWKQMTDPSHSSVGVIRPDKRG